ncbi:CPBP family intramembrane metalloprotease [Duganella sp. BJB1802]|uniref:CPBP family intramembrane glutamic endopeptidase n=1 Tax=Duganella sp. BJB1802 TaxID=2744575 RepID=UPI00159332C0|nr:CPBP family intramembrane glutamic endopeptidase [Duganella sp. BJB1802]NVD70942.1 CPBP family intramembrane metalloprotease [Duganella sp. BJB1802]
MEKPVYRPFSRSLWLGLLAGGVAVMLLNVMHLYLLQLRYPPGATAIERFNDHSDTALWLWLQLLDFAGGIAAGALVARWSPRGSWRALWLAAAGLLAYSFFDFLPHTKSWLRCALWFFAVPSGVLCGGALYRWRERGRAEEPARAAPADHMQDLPHTPLPQALLIMAICFGGFILDSFGIASGGSDLLSFNDGVFAAIAVQELILACVALAVLHASHYPLATLLTRPSLGGLGMGAALYLVAGLAALGVGLLFGDQPAQPVNAMLAQSHVTLYALVPMALINGTFEEVFLLAYLQRGLRRFGASNAIGAAILVRLLCHWYQGPVGAAKVLAMGLVFGIYYARSGRLFPVIAAHVAADFLPFLDVVQ